VYGRLSNEAFRLTDVWATKFLGDGHLGDMGGTFGLQHLDVLATNLEMFG